MKEFLILILSLFIYFPVIAQTKTDCAYQQLTGKVKSVEAFSLNLNQPTEPTDFSKKIPSYLCRYDTQGNLTEILTYNPSDGNIQEKRVYKFDEKGRNIGYDEYHNSKNQLITIPRKHVYTLDEFGRTIEYRVFESNGNPAGRFTYKYDSRGNKIEDGYYRHTGLLGGKTTFTYDADNQQTSEVSYNSEGIINWKNISTYDPQKNSVEKLQYQGEILKYKVITKIDDKTRIIEQETIEYNATGNKPIHSPIPGKIIYRYDDKARTTLKESYSPNGNLISSSLTSFDIHGNQIEYRPLKTYNTIINTTKYEYDSRNNWTKRISVSDGGNNTSTKFYYFSERLITYY